MKLAWLEGLRADDKDKMKDAFKSSLFLRTKLASILNKKTDAERKSLITKSSYDNPNWALIQADSVGYQRAMQEVINLVTD